MQVQQTIKYNVIGKFLNHLLVFVNNIIITRILGAELSGYFFNELYILSFLVFLGSFGFDYSLVYLLSKHTVNLNNLCKKLFIIIVAFCATVFLCYTTGLLSLQQPLIAILLLSSGNLILIIFQAILSAYSKFSIQNLVLVFTNFALLLYLLIVYQPFSNSVSYGYNTFNTIAVILGAAYLLQGIFFYIMVKFGAETNGSVIINWKKLLSTGLLMMLSSLIFFAYLRVDNFFVEKYCDPVILSNYVQCGKIGQYFLYLPAIVGSTLLPYYVKNNQHLSYAHWKKMVQPYLYILFIGAVILALSGSYIFPLLFGEDFNEMYKIMMIFLPGFFCLGVLTLVNAVYFSKGNLITIITGDLMGLILVVLLDYIFVPKYGVYAAAIISSFSYMITLLYLLYHLQKQFLAAE